MKTNTWTLAILFFLLFFAACSTQKKESEKIIEAQKTYNELMKIHDDVMVDFVKSTEVLEALLDKISNEKKDSIAVNQMKDIVAALQKTNREMKDWMDNITEVSSKEAKGHEGHNHKKDVKGGLTDDEMLRIQQEMKTQVLKIEKDYKENLSKADKFLKK